MRIMYWISDLCSSDLLRHAPGRPQRRGSLRPDGGVERAHRDRHSHRRGDRRLQGSRSGGAAGAHCAWSRHLSWGVSAMTAKGTPAAPEETPFWQFSGSVYARRGVAEACLALQERHRDRKSVVSGKSVAVRVDLGGRGVIKKKNKH